MFLSKLNNGIYHIYYYKENGKKSKISTGTKLKSEANKFLADFTNKLKDQQKTKVIPIKLMKLLDEYLKYSESVHSWNTTLSIKSTVNALNDYFGDIAFNSITHDCQGPSKPASQGHENLPPVLIDFASLAISILRVKFA